MMRVTLVKIVLSIVVKTVLDDDDEQLMSNLVLLLS